MEGEIPEPVAVDTVVMVPSLAKGSGGLVREFGFPRGFILEGIDAEGETVLLADETGRDFPNPAGSS